MSGLLAFTIALHIGNVFVSPLVYWFMDNCRWNRGLTINTVLWVLGVIPGK